MLRKVQFARAGNSARTASQSGVGGFALDILRRLCQRHIGRLLCAPLDNLNKSLREFLPDRDAIRDADQVGILEFDARPLIAIVEKCIETGGACMRSRGRPRPRFCAHRSS